MFYMFTSTVRCCIVVIVGKETFTKEQQVKNSLLSYSAELMNISKTTMAMAERRGIDLWFHNAGYDSDEPDDRMRKISDQPAASPVESEPNKQPYPPQVHESV
jgi:hypothetical protein